MHVKMLLMEESPLWCTQRTGKNNLNELRVNDAGHNEVKFVSQTTLIYHSVVVEKFVLSM